MQVAPAIERFIEAQNNCAQFDSALAEMTAGRKRGHWIWYVFPQMTGLGGSEISRKYAIRDHDEAVAYLRHPVLYSRLLAITTVVAEHLAHGMRVETLMSSSTDAKKLVSSLTLFATVAAALAAAGRGAECTPFVKMAERVLTAASSQGYPACRYTLSLLA